MPRTFGERHKAAWRGRALGRRRKKDNKNSKKRSKFVEPSGLPAELHKRWDRKATLIENYKRLGLALDSNNPQPPLEGESGPILANIPVPEPTPRAGKKISPQEQRYYLDLITKHKDNYIAMARDIKTNYMQYTSTKLEKKCKEYLAVYHQLNVNTKIFEASEENR